MVVLIVKK